MNDRTRQISVIVLSVLQIFTNTLAGIGIGLPADVGSISDSFSNFFTPAGITFSVWTPIYIGLTLYAIYQALPGQATRTIHRRIGWLAVSAAAANALWTPVFVLGGEYGSAGFQPAFIFLSLVIMVWLLVTLATIFVRLRNMGGDLKTTDKALVEVPFYGYFAWINVATVANVTTVLITLGWEGTQAGAIWSVMAIVAAVLITSGVILYSRGSWGTGAYLAVLIWALAGVYLGNSEQSMLVGVTAILAAIVLIGVAGFRFMNRDGQSPTAPVPNAA